MLTEVVSNTSPASIETIEPESASPELLWSRSISGNKSWADIIRLRGSLSSTDALYATGSPLPEPDVKACS